LEFGIIITSNLILFFERIKKMSIAINLKTFTDKISDRDFERLCADNPETKFEITKDGKLIVMPPTGSLTGQKNADLIYQVQAWNRQTKLGKVFDSSTGFKLSNGAVLSPDVSWIAIKRWNSLDAQQQQKFAPIDPDFASQRVVGVPPIEATDEGVIELMSPTDDLDELQPKMTEYMSCPKGYRSAYGVKLGWLINRADKQVEIYRVGQKKEILNNPQSLFGEELMPGLIVDLLEIL
jgi:Uma2 family endonuclease